MKLAQVRFTGSSGSEQQSLIWAHENTEVVSVYSFQSQIFRSKEAAAVSGLSWRKAMLKNLPFQRKRGGAVLKKSPIETLTSVRVEKGRDFGNRNVLIEIDPPENA